MRSLLRILAPTAAALPLLVAFVGCGGDDDTPDPTRTTAVVDESLEGQLSSILLSEADIPAGLQGSGLAFSTNADVAGPNQREFDRLTQLGRLLGVDLTFIPTESLPANEVVRGGIQNSASVYENEFGATSSFQETSIQARATDWTASYDNLTDIQVVEVPQTVGDESLWIRISGVQTCALETPAGESPTGPVETFACPDGEVAIDDYVIFRAGRTRSLVKVLSSHPAGSSRDTYQDQIKAWADIVAQRATTTFGDAAS